MINYLYSVRFTVRLLKFATVVEWEKEGPCSRPLYNVPPLCSQGENSLLQEHTTDIQQPRIRNN